MSGTTIPLESESEDEQGYIFVEVSEPEFEPTLPASEEQTQPPGFEQTGAAEDLTLAVALKTMPLLRGTLKTLSRNIQAGFADTPPESWQLELNIGFKGVLAVPVLLKDGAEASLKITATWKNPQK